MQALVSLREEDPRLETGAVHYHQSYKKSYWNSHSDGGAAFLEKIQNSRHQLVDSFQLFARNRIFPRQSVDVQYGLSYIRSALLFLPIDKGDQYIDSNSGRKKGIRSVSFVSLP